MAKMADTSTAAYLSSPPPSFHRSLSATLHADALHDLQVALSSGRRTALLTGGDSLARRSLSYLALPSARTFSCVPSHISGIKDLLSLVGASGALILHDIDSPDATPALVALLDSHIHPLLATAAAADTVPLSLRRAHRLDVHVTLRAPRPYARLSAWLAVLEHLVPALSTERANALAETLANVTPGFGMRDILRAAMTHQTRLRGTDIDAAEETNELLKGVCTTRPSGSDMVLPFAASVQDHKLIIGWADVGGYEEQKAQLERALGWGVTHNKTFSRLGARAPRGVLLHGARGTGKTFLAHALMARLPLINCLCVASSDLYARYLGESEQRVRALFAKARELAPCIVLLDDVDAIAADRAAEEEGEGTGVERRVLGALLAELDGVGADEGDASVAVLACTAHVHRIDPALLRPGRIDRLVEMPLPDVKDRVEILMCVARNMPVAEEGGNEIDDAEKLKVFRRVAQSTEGRTGADLAAICRRAALVAMEESEEPNVVLDRHFKLAVTEICGATVSNG